MALVECDKLLIDYADPRIKNSKKTVDDVFKQFGPNLTVLFMQNAEDLIFPVKSVDAQLRKHPERVKNVAHLSLQFDRCNSVQLLKMVASRFPKIESLRLNYSHYNHPVEQALAQFSRMPNLIELHFDFPLQDLYECMKTNNIETFPKMQVLHFGITCLTDKYEQFEATIPVLFPNLNVLDFTCPSKTFTDRFQANVRRLFPRLTKCQAVDAGDVLSSFMGNAKQVMTKKHYRLFLDRHAKHLLKGRNVIKQILAQVN